MAISFAACGVEGKYKFESMTVKILGAETTFHAGEEYLGQELSKDWFTLELNNDGTCAVKTNESNTAVKGTWTEEDGVIKFDVVGISIGKATREGNKIILNYGIMTITLKK